MQHWEQLLWERVQIISNPSNIAGKEYGCQCKKRINNIHPLIYKVSISCKKFNIEIYIWTLPGKREREKKKTELKQKILDENMSCMSEYKQKGCMLGGTISCRQDKRMEISE